MKIKLNCLYAKHESGTMRVMCQKINGYCVHQFYKRCKGWWTLTEQAARCPLKEAEK